MIDCAAKLTQLADSYLDHIRIAVEAGDAGGPFRDFIDNWAAFSNEVNHHRSTGNRVVWFNNPDAIGRRAMLLSLPFRSTGADAILHYAAEQANKYRERRKMKDKTVKLIVDHAVPLAVIVEEFFKADADLSRAGVRKHLERRYYLGLLTDAEDVRLNRIGLRSHMPANWDGNDLTARYREAGIAAADQPDTSQLAPQSPFHAQVDQRPSLIGRSGS